MDKNEQWKGEGNCDICRRKNYCRKLCKPAKLRQQAEIANVIANAMFKAISKGTSDKSKE